MHVIRFGGCLLVSASVIFLSACGGKDREAIKSADALVLERKYDQALLVLQKALREDPKNKKLLRHQVRLFLKSEQVNYAIAAYRKLNDVNPDDTVLFDTLKDKDAVVRITTAKALGLMKTPHSVGPLIAAVKDEEKSVRQAAVLALGDLKDKKAIPVLIQSLKDSDWFVRAEAALALGKVGDSQATTELFKLLADEDSYVRQNARKALQELATEENKPAYLEALKSSDRAIANMAAVALAQTGDNLGLPVLIEQLPSSKALDQLEIIRAMVKLGDRSAIPALRNGLDNNDVEVKALCALALGEFKDTASVEKLKKMVQDKTTDRRLATACLISLNKISSSR
jgi:HEAT repeat protein